jgi:hypothetical protein
MRLCSRFSEKRNSENNVDLVGTGRKVGGGVKGGVGHTVVEKGRWSPLRDRDRSLRT